VAAIQRAYDICSWIVVGPMLGTRHASDGDIFLERPRALMARGVLERNAVAVGGGPRPRVRTRASKRQRGFGRKM